MSTAEASVVHVVHLAQGQEVDVEIAEEADDGTPVSDNQPTVWSTSDPTMVAIKNVAPNGLSATLEAVGGPRGQATITITVEAPKKTLAAAFHARVEPAKPPAKADALSRLRVRTGDPR